MLRHWSQFVPNMSANIRGHEARHHQPWPVETPFADQALQLAREGAGEVGRAQELCENRGGRPGLPVHNSPHGL